MMPNQPKVYKALAIKTMPYISMKGVKPFLRMSLSKSLALPLPLPLPLQLLKPNIFKNQPKMHLPLQKLILLIQSL
jgi:hypothetical protein